MNSEKQNFLTLKTSDKCSYLEQSEDKWYKNLVM